MENKMDRRDFNKLLLASPMILLPAQEIRAQIKPKKVTELEQIERYMQYQADKRVHWINKKFSDEAGVVVHELKHTLKNGVSEFFSLSHKRVFKDTFCIAAQDYFPIEQFYNQPWYSCMSSLHGFELNIIKKAEKFKIKHSSKICIYADAHTKPGYVGFYGFCDTGFLR